MSRKKCCKKNKAKTFGLIALGVTAIAAGVYGATKINTEKLDEFRKQWSKQIAGVWKKWM